MDVTVLMDICRLTDDFMKDYPLAQYPELMYKAGRPYNCLLVDVHVDDYFIFIPYRSHICLLYTSPSPRDGLLSRMPSSA